MEVWQHVLCVTWKVRSGTIRFASTRDSPKAVRRMVRLLAPSQRGQHDIFIVISAIISFAFLMFTPLFVKRVSGVCMDCREPPLSVKNACQGTPNFAVGYSRRLCLCITSGLTTLDTVKNRLYSCLSTLGSKTFKVKTELLSITSVQGTVTGRLTGMGMTLMVKTARIRVFYMTN